MQTVPARPVPAGPWGRTWLVALALIAGAVGGLELDARRHGYQPSVKDDEYAWAWQRARAADGSPHTVALAGTSRILLAFSRPAFEHALPGWTPVQLAIDGSQPGGVVVDLANDPDFRGVVIVDTNETGIVPATWHVTAPYVRAYRRRWRAPGAMVERWLATEVQSRFALLADRGVHAAVGLVRGMRSPRYVVTFPDRTQYADFSHTDAAAHHRREVARLMALGPAHTPSPDAAAQWLHHALALEPYVDRIQARGGRVVYVHLPECDERWAYDQIAMPEAMYWDQLAAHTHALAIHFADYPSLRDFACPDTVHLDSKDAPRFTRALIAILTAKGVFAR